METVSISRFKATCVALLEQVKRSGRPIREAIAEIMPPASLVQSRSWLGSFASTGRIVGDIVSPPADESAWESLAP